MLKVLNFFIFISSAVVYDLRVSQNTFVNVTFIQIHSMSSPTVDQSKTHDFFCCLTGITVLKVTFINKRIYVIEGREIALSRYKMRPTFLWSLTFYIISPLNFLNDPVSQSSDHVFEHYRIFFGIFEPKRYSLPVQPTIQGWKKSRTQASVKIFQRLIWVEWSLDLWFPFNYFRNDFSILNTLLIFILSTIFIFWQIFYIAVIFIYNLLFGGL